jgi:hypothetical protein
MSARAPPRAPYAWPMLLRMDAARGPAIAAVLTAGAMTLAACGSSGSSRTIGSAAGPRTTAVPNATQAPVAPGVDPAADRRAANQAVMRLADFPSGWQQEDNSAVSEPPPCPGVREAREAATARGEASTFSDGDSTSTTNVTYTYADEQAAKRAFDVWSSRATRLCLGRETGRRVREASGPGGQGFATVGRVSTSRLAVEPLGDDRAAARVTVPLSAPGIDVDISADFVFVRVGRGLVELTFVDTHTRFDADLRKDLIAKLTRRLSAAIS